jgi:stage II sporulation protein M
MIKKNVIRKKFFEAWNFLKNSKNFIYAGIFIFFIFAFIGFFASLSENLVAPLLEYIQELVAQTKDYGFLKMFLFLLGNNLSAAFFSLIFGFLLGIFPLFVGMTNGFVVGIVSKKAVLETGYSSLLSLFPHGIFELPALFIAMGIGMKFGTFIFRKNVEETLIDYFVNGMRIFFFFIIPLLIIAAIIESLLIVF